MAMTSNAPPDLLTELCVPHYTGLVRRHASETQGMLFEALVVVEERGSDSGGLVLIDKAQVECSPQFA